MKGRKDYGTLMMVEFLGDPYHPLGGKISSFERITILLSRLGLDCWMEDCNVKARL